MRRDALLLAEMIDAAETARALVADLNATELTTDRQRRDALLWNFTVLGEAAMQVGQDTKDRFPAIPWAYPSRLRNRIVHGYWSIDVDVLHTTATAALPSLIDQLRAALAAIELEADVEPD